MRQFAGAHRTQGGEGIQGDARSARVVPSRCAGPGGQGQDEQPVSVSMARTRPHRDGRGASSDSTAPAPVRLMVPGLMVFRS